ncbi:MAG TPA: hypothetical protein VM240_04810 [Verrucomicrobiae bacterium]|nr:hypothetical protein [Verrucomicrobiae bacterium]
MLDRIFALALVLCPLTAAASETLGPEATSEFSGRVVYRIEFGGVASKADHGLNFRLQHSDLHTAIVDTQLGAQGLQRFAVNGVDLTTVDPALGQAGKTRYFLNLTGIQWLGIGVATLALVAVVAGSGGGGDEPAVPASGGN